MNQKNIRALRWYLSRHSKVNANTLGPTLMQDCLRVFAHCGVTEKHVRRAARFLGLTFKEVA